jgi:protein-export membrane protein SecD
MKRKTWSRFLVSLLTVFAVMYILPSVVGADKLPGWYTSLFSKSLNYGLDIKGGLELRFAVDYKKAIGDNTRRVGETLVTRLAEKMAEADGKGIESLTKDQLDGYRKRVSTEVLDYGTLKLTFQSDGDKGLLDNDLLQQSADRYEIVSSDGNTYTLRMSDANVFEIRDNVVSETVSILGKRVDSFGLVEPDVRRNGDSEVDVQLPGVKKEHMALVRERLGQTAQLTFRMVDHTEYFGQHKAALDTYKQQNPTKARTIEVKPDPDYGHNTITAQSKAELVSFVKTLPIPDDHIVGYELVETKKGGITSESYWKTHYIVAKVELSGDYLTRALVLNDPQEGWYVNLELNSEGADVFANVTEQNVGKDMAIMLDDDISSAPRIQERIPGGRARITLGGNKPPNEILEDAKSLVTVLNHGAYKAPVHKVHDHEVGPSLGADAIRAGTIALSVGFLAVVLFMGFYYGTAGWIANLVLMLNLVFIVAALVNFNAALTLPGMAGIILTIGMAVDANVLIFERIREELREGRSAKAAMEAGYERAFWTIFDSNITTALAAVILLNFTTGPIYGFAVVLLTGIVFSVITAYWISKMVYEYLLEKRQGRGLSIGIAQK